MKAIDGSLISQVLVGGSIFGGDYDGRLGPLTDWVNNNAHLFKGKTILDLGSNAGHFPIEYIRAGAEKVIAVEGRPEFFDQWKEFNGLMPLDLSGVEWWTSDVRDWQTPSKVDVVSCLGLLYHIDYFMPKLRQLSEHAELVLIETQIASDTRLQREKPDNRTMALDAQDVIRGSTDFWERMIYGHFGGAFNVSRAWLLAYGDSYRVRQDGKLGMGFDLTLRAFYILSRKDADLNFQISNQTGCLDITKQEIRNYDVEP